MFSTICATVLRGRNDMDVLRVGWKTVCFLKRKGIPRWTCSTYLGIFHFFFSWRWVIFLAERTMLLVTRKVDRTFPSFQVAYSVHVENSILKSPKYTIVSMYYKWMHMWWLPLVLYFRFIVLFAQYHILPTAKKHETQWTQWIENSVVSEIRFNSICLLFKNNFWLSFSLAFWARSRGQTGSGKSRPH